MKAYIYPGQGSQYPGMAKNLYEQFQQARELFEKANDLLGFRITDIMFNGTADELKATRVTQPAIFLHSVIRTALIEDFSPDMVAGHSLGEFSALVAARVLSFEDGLKLVSKRAEAMQRACEQQPSTMAAVLGLDDDLVEKICAQIDDIVVAANFNCPGQVVISGTTTGVDKAAQKLKEAGAKRVLILPVGGAFHSPLMAPAREELAVAIGDTPFNQPVCPVYQNVTARAETDPANIRANLIEQLTSPVKWTQTIRQMVADGASEFIEVGPGKVLQGLVKKIAPEASVAGME